jgi:uncharacterized membrane protein YbhN (UPF0104 family)
MSDNILKPNSTQDHSQEQQPEVEVKEEVQSVFNKNLIIKGSLWFALITVLTIAGIFFYNNTGETVEALTHISFKYIAICLVMLFVDLMLGSWRNHIYIRKLAPAVSYWVSFRANVANMFMGAVTPAHGGGWSGSNICIYQQWRCFC